MTRGEIFTPNIIDQTLRLWNALAVLCPKWTLCDNLKTVLGEYLFSEYLLKYGWGIALLLLDHIKETVAWSLTNTSGFYTDIFGPLVSSRYIPKEPYGGDHIQMGTDIDVGDWISDTIISFMNEG